MGHERRIRGAVLIFTLLMSAGCGKETEEGTIQDGANMTDVTVSYGTGAMNVKAIDPDENLVSDISIIIFDENGDAEECLWMCNGSGTCTVRLVKDRRYTFAACANFGYAVTAADISELSSIRYHMAYPDEYKEGIPMYAVEEVLIKDNMSITLGLVRLMSKISIKMDRSRLSEDIKMNVRSVKIGNCPKSVKVFGHSRVSDSDDCFVTGFIRGDMETQELNRNGSSGIGISKEVSLYMLENMQGEFPSDIADSREKIFGDDDHRKETCSYIEMELEYMSKEYRSDGRYLIYRFYLGDGISNLDVERNSLYTITVCPEDDGLSDDGWRVDKSGLSPASPPSFNAYPSGYIRGDIGERIHIWCEFTPEYTTFDVGREYMEEDKANGIYDYVIDEDGHGAVLELTGPGRGLIYMEAGSPVNDSALFVIEVNLPAS